MKKTPLLMIGITGFTIVLALNLVGLILLKQPAAEFFSERWWPTWFTNYVVWGSFIMIGATLRVKKSEAVET